MKILDFNGFEIEISDLDGAIEQADLFRDLHHIPPVPSDDALQAYWKDMHEKLLKIKSEEYEQSSG